MSVVKEPEVIWNPDQMVEVTLNEPDDFLKVRETLTRIGVASRKEKKIYQSCHILHKQGRNFLVHFKELLPLLANTLILLLTMFSVGIVLLSFLLTGGWLELLMSLEYRISHP